MSSQPETTGVWTLVVAAGSSARFGTNKLDVVLHGDQTVFDMSVLQAARASEGIVVVVRAGDPLLHAKPTEDVVVVAGGANRSASVRAGLAVVPAAARFVLVHDAARPLADAALYARVVAALRAGAAAAVPVVPVVDTIRSVTGGVVDREQLRAVQTPQGFQADVVRRAHAQASDATDDATLAERAGFEVVLVEGDVRNLKITRPADIAVAQAQLVHPS